MGFHKIPTIDAAFWSMVDKRDGEDSCWVWTGGTKLRKGVTIAWFKHKSYALSANRYAYQSCFGDTLPPCKKLQPKPNCTDPMCVRPDHFVPMVFGAMTRNERKLRNEAGEAAERERCLVAVKSAHELRAARDAPVDLSGITKELEIHRAALARTLRILGAMSDSLNGLYVKVDAIAARSPAPTREDLAELLRAELAPLVASLTAPLEPKADQIVVQQVLDNHVPAEHGPDIDDRDVANELATVLGPGWLSDTDESNCAAVRAIAESHGGGPVQTRERLSAWIRTFRSLVASDVLMPTSDQFLEAASTGLLSSGTEIR